MLSNHILLYSQIGAYPNCYQRGFTQQILGRMGNHGQGRIIGVREVKDTKYCCYNLWFQRTDIWNISAFKNIHMNSQNQPEQISSLCYQKWLVQSAVFLSFANGETKYKAIPQAPERTGIRDALNWVSSGFDRDSGGAPPHLFMWLQHLWVGDLSLPLTTD